MRSNVFVKLTSDSADRVFYLGVLGFGVTTILLLKLANQNGMAVSVAASLIVLYAVSCLRIDRFRLSEERVGDNCYYLGFIFTLVSLAFALWAFDKGREADELVSDFGLALASTIVGIGARVVIQQFRIDVEEVGAGTRLSLTEAADQTKAELLNVVAEIQQLSLAYRDKLSQLNADLTKDAIATVEQVRADLAHHKALSSSLRQSYEKLGASNQKSIEAMILELGLVAPSISTQRNNLEIAFSALSDTVRNARLEAPPTLFDSMKAAIEQSSLSIRSISRDIGESEAALRNATDQLSRALVAAAGSATGFSLATPAELYAPIEAALNHASSAIDGFASRLLETVTRYEQANFQIPESAFDPLRTGLVEIINELSRLTLEIAAAERARLVEITENFSQIIDRNVQSVSDGVTVLAEQNQNLDVVSQRLEGNAVSLNASITSLNSAVLNLTTAISEANRRFEPGSTTFSLFGRRN